LNGATCLNGNTDSFSCTCAPGFGGQYCADQACTAATCNNNGECITSGGSNTCQCYIGYTGSTCATLSYQPCIREGLNSDHMDCTKYVNCVTVNGKLVAKVSSLTTCATFTYTGFGTYPGVFSSVPNSCVAYYGQTDVATTNTANGFTCTMPTYPI